MSLKTKIALAVSLLFVLFVTTASYFTLSSFERSFKESIATQQRSLVLSQAHNIDDKLKIAQNALIAVAAVAPGDVFVNPDKGQRFLDGNVGLLSIFDNGIFFINREGRLIVESPYRPNRRGKELWFREWVQKTVNGQKPVISDPYFSTHTPGQPAIVMTVPIFDKRGNLTGMMTGSLDLLGGNFLAELSTTRVGKGGYLYITDSNRTMIVHPERARIMKPAAPPGVNKFFDKAFNGFEGSGETITSYGIPMLASAKRLSMTSWILVANFPTSEVYAPLERTNRYFGIATVACTFTLLFLTWFIMKHLMRPLAAVKLHMEQLPNKYENERLIKIQTKDEIGVLATTFNNMLNTLDQQQEDLHKQTVMLEEEMAERQMAQEALVAKQQQLEALNNSLEERIANSLREIRQKDQMLIQQSRHAAMGEMINSIAHQWRQPLNNIGLIVQNIKLSYESGQLTLEEMTVENEKAMDTILFMSRTIDDFRYFFRNDKQKTSISIIDLLQRTLALVSGNFGHLKISSDIEVRGAINAFGYPNEYSQVILNILNNAKDVLTERMVAAPCIRVRAFCEEGRAVLTIWDNGGGIEEEILPKIFDPYFSTKEVGKGTGIGLYMSKVIIEQNMGGLLTARNIDGGAEFRIELASHTVTEERQDPSYAA
ncbi:MAG: cache domain-containing protein [Desulfuromonadaceae bacterium]|nr:cache domain-containing protein [Desulfuromonadaceae bacterium]